jgi:cyclopropane fatty-acyl-phospholipid synthase-like methyltransferase
MHKRWPYAKVTGMDISTLSIQIANKMFADDKLHFIESILTPETFSEEFDLVIFMDVYEHIAVKDRTDVHAALAKLLLNEGRIILTVPTPHNLKWSLINKPETMQPVDEHISYEVIGKMAADTGTEVILYEKKNVWNVGDYSHVVLERNSDFEAAFFKLKPVTARQRGIRIFNKIKYKLGSFFRKYYVHNKLG